MFEDLANCAVFLCVFFKERTDCGSLESSLYEGLVELFPESYSSGGFDTADSGKLLVLSDLLTAIRQFSPSDRCVVCVCACVLAVPINWKGPPYCFK